MALRLPSPVHAGQFPSLAGGEYRESPALASAVSAIAQRKRQGRRQAAEMQYQQNAFDQQDKIAESKTLAENIKQKREQKIYGIVNNIKEKMAAGQMNSIGPDIKALRELDEKVAGQVIDQVNVQAKLSKKAKEDVAKDTMGAAQEVWSPDPEQMKANIDPYVAKKIQEAGGKLSRDEWTQADYDEYKRQLMMTRTAVLGGGKAAKLAWEGLMPEPFRKPYQDGNKGEFDRLALELKTRNEQADNARADRELALKERKEDREASGNGKGTDKAVGEKAYERSVERFEDLKAKAGNGSVAWGELLAFAFLDKIPNKIIKKSGLSEEDAKELQFHSNVLKRYYEQKGIDPQGMFDAEDGGSAERTVVREGTAANGRRVREYSDGTVEYAD